MSRCLKVTESFNWEFQLAADIVFVILVQGRNLVAWQFLYQGSPVQGPKVCKHMLVFSKSLLKETLLVPKREARWWIGSTNIQVVSN